MFPRMLCLQATEWKDGTSRHVPQASEDLGDFWQAMRIILCGFFGYAPAEENKQAASRHARRVFYPTVAAATIAILLGGSVADAGFSPITPPSLVSAQSTLALRLVGTLAARQPGANFVVSPASLASALAVVARGGDLKLEATLHKLLGFKASPTAWVDFEMLRDASARVRENGPFESANAILFDIGVFPYREAIAALSRTGVQASVDDFRKAETLTKINAWVSEHTKGKIPTILEQLSPDTGLVALNALYFKDRWKQPFDPNETRPMPFHLVGGQTVETPLMHSTAGRFRFRQDARFVAVDLPYATRGYSLIVVTTKGDPVAAKDFAGLSEWLSGTGFVEAPGEVALPRFSVTANVDLMPALAAMGFRAPRTLPRFARGTLHLAKAQQRVELKVDEEGTEAAAASAVTADRSMHADFVKMTVDKPFVFALRDATSGLIVVAGYIAKPAPPAEAALN